MEEQKQEDVQEKRKQNSTSRHQTVWGGGGRGRSQFAGTNMKLQWCPDGSVTMEREVKTCDAVFLTGVSYLGEPAYY